jgi:hypothetical protein
MSERYFHLVTLERLVREWRDAQKAIEDMPQAERERDLEPIRRSLYAHNALFKFADEVLGP